jgi:hypothetical protein
MAVIDTNGTVLQSRPSTGGAWNSVTVSGRTAQKSTTWGKTLAPGQLTQALAAANQMLFGGAGTQDRLAQKTARALGLDLQDKAGLATGQAGAGVTANVLDRGDTQGGPATVTITTTAGATPTATYQIEGSLDNSSWSPLSTADSATPTNFSTATFTITSSTTVTRIVNPSSAWRYLRVTVSAVTNVSSTIDAACV